MALATPRRREAGLGLALLALLLACTSLTAAQHYAEGSAALDRGEVERAIAELERAAALVPHASEVQNHLGLAYTAAMREDQALRAFERALELDCDNAAARSNLLAAERHFGARP